MVQDISKYTKNVDNCLNKKTEDSAENEDCVSSRDDDFNNNNNYEEQSDDLKTSSTSGPPSDSTSVVTQESPSYSRWESHLTKNCKTLY